MNLKLNKNLFLSFLLFVGLMNILHAQIWVNYNENDGLLDGAIYGIVQDKDENLWFSSWVNPGGDLSIGISKFDGTDFINYSTADGLPSNQVFQIIIDSNNNLWATTSLGLARYDGTNWTTFNQTNGLLGVQSWGVFEDNDGNIWASVFDESMFKYVWHVYDGMNWTTINDSRGHREIVQDDDGNIWTCDDDGVHRYDGTDWITYSDVNGSDLSIAFSLFVDNDNNLWVGSYSGSGLNKFDGDSWTTFTIANGLAENRVRAIMQHSNGDLWFGTNEGISVFDGTTWLTYDMTDGLIENHVRAFFEDLNGEIWIGTWEGVSRVLEQVNTEKINFNSDIKIFPNPTASDIQIQSDQLEIKTITLYDVLGRQIFTENVTNNFIDLESLEPGSYFILFEDSDGKYHSSRVVKN